MKGAWIIADQIYTYFNPSIYEEGFDAPYFFYGSDAFTSYYQAKCTLTNSDLRGVGSRANQHLKFTNLTNNSIKTNYNNLTRVDGYNSGFTSNSSLTPSNGIDQLTQNRQIIKNGFNNINLVFRLDTDVSKSFSFTGISTARQPVGEVRTICLWGDNNINGVDGFGSVTVSGGTLSGTINGTPNNRYAYVKINVTYPIFSSESVEY